LFGSAVDPGRYYLGLSAGAGNSVLASSVVV
jgi:hypothetical protein